MERKRERERGRERGEDRKQRRNVRGEEEEGDGVEIKEGGEKERNTGRRQG
jgi:hypothetical protein